MPHLVIVRRDQAKVYDRLKLEFAHEPHAAVYVVWDRRQSERRDRIGEVKIDRRHRERRGDLPMIWKTFGVVVVAIER